MQGTVRALFIAPEKKATSVSVPSVQTTSGGFDGDYHALKANGRQVLMVSSSILEQLELEPGAISENIVLDGIDVMSLREGQQLRMGQAILEVTGPCEPCGQMDRIRSGLKKALSHRRGMFAKVVRSGEIRVGDVVEY